jgi:3',5'-cyclic-AMP phosphodiesterase
LNQRHRTSPSRRDLMRAGVFAGAGIVAGGGITRGEQAGPRSGNPAAPLRVAHLTDMHVQPERRAGEGYVAALESLGRINPTPDLLVTGGDHVMDATGQTLDRTRAQWAVYQKAMNHTTIPTHALLGNHDIFGWGRPKEVSESTVGYGRALAMDQLELERSYYSFDAGGWHFVMLDSMTRRENSYVGLLAREQYEWLKGDLAAARRETPVAVFSHIPLLSACVFFDGEDRVGPTAWNVPDSYMHRDTPALLDLFATHNVRLLVSGHIHLVDRVEYRGMTFICDGAVCGNWWRGPRQQFPEGYGVIDLYPDGRFEHRYATYGWKAEA